jgi:AraC family transcriptional regulator
MFRESVKSNYNKSINEVINYILKHLEGDLSLKKLAGVANYSEFHFQKLFKQTVGATPKQFITKTKLEYAGFLIMHQNKPIAEIAIDCGYSSPSVFSRSFKNYFGLSAGELRGFSEKERMDFLKNKSFIKELLQHETALSGLKKSDDLVAITVKKVGAIRGIFSNASLRGDEIINAFRKSIQMAETMDAEISNSNYMGVIYPHQHIYRAVITINPGTKILKKEVITEIKAGRYATFKLSGELEKTFNAIHFFYKHWLPQSGYQVSGMDIFEMLSQNPVGRSYNEIEREVHIPIEHVG